MRKYFITGLALLLPVVLTLIIVIFVMNLLTNPFLDFTKNLLSYFNIIKENGNYQDVILLVSKIFILLFLFIITLITGLLAQIYIIRYVVSAGEQLIEKIPFVSRIYISVRDVIKSLFVSGERKFNKVVLVPYPSQETLSIGFVTNDHLPQGSDSQFENLVPVFVPAGPNPTLGFMLMYKQDDLTYIDMKIDDALKTIISLGVVANGFTRTLHPHETTKKDEE